MRPFSYARPGEVGSAIGEVSANPTARFIAGGTNLIDLMKEDVEQPTRLVDVNHLPLGGIEELPNGGLRLGALVTNAATAYHPLVEQRYPLLSRTILAGASPQLRNKATNGGNLFQRTRCYYFYDTATPCNKRDGRCDGPSGCGAIGGYNRIHAILGESKHCIATHPSDMCVALAALEAIVRVSGPNGEREVPFAEFHRLPGDEPWRDHTLEPGELVTAIDLPPNGYPDHFTYLKIRDRSSYSFALVSVAVGLTMGRGDGRGDTITDARIALGGVAHKPWRRPEAEALLVGKPATEESYRPVAELLLEGATGYGTNTFKIELAKRAIVRALDGAVHNQIWP